MADEDGSTKRCKKCGLDKPITEFRRDLRRRTTRQTACRDCVLARGRAYAAANRAKQTERARLWALANPERQKANRAAHYQANKRLAAAQTRAWREANRERVKAAGRLRYQKNREHILARKRHTGREWRMRNKDRVRLAAKAYYKANSAIFKQARDRYLARRRAAPGQHTQADVAAILVAQKGRCAYCRTDIRKYYEVDHIVSLSKGGTHDRSNLQITCRACNAKKRDLDPLVFARQTGRLL